MRNCINVSQKNNLVIIKIHPEAKIEDIIPQIRKKASQLQKIYKQEKTHHKRDMLFLLSYYTTHVF